MAQFKHHRVALGGTVLHVGLLVCLFVLYVSHIQGAKKIFDEFGLTLPWLTMTVIRFSNWFAEYWWAVAPVVLAAVIVQYAVLAFADEHSSRVGIKFTWIIMVALLLAMLIGVTMLVIELPMLKLKEGLAR